MQISRASSVDDYFLEGHVPIDAVKSCSMSECPSPGSQLQDAIRSLGMGGSPEPYDIIEIPRDSSDMYIYLSFEPD